VTSFGRTLLVEVQRNLARRLVRVLILLAIGACAVAGALTWAADDDGPDRFQPQGAQVVDGQPDPTPWALDLVELWPANGGDPILAMAAVPLMMGGLIAGASMIGAEWRAGTVTTNLTWEPRRVRLAAAKFTATALVAFVVAILLQVVFVLALLPNIAAHGSFDGADADWWASALGGLGRGAALTGLIAVAGASLAMIGRNTATAIGVGFVLVSILEPIARAWKPALDRWLLTSNTAWSYIGERGVDDNGSTYTAGRAGAIVVVYLVALAAVAIALFRRRDVASAG
jgi:hypothetical protein